MRVTHNYGNGMINFRRKKGSQDTMSLLQRALSRNSTSSRANRLAALLGNRNTNSTRNVSDRNFVTSASKPQKFYHDMQYHAKQVGEYGEALAVSEKDSPYDKARESGSTEQIVSDIEGFVKQYNNMLGDLKESGTRTDTSLLTQLNSMARAAERSLSTTGISRKADGTLVIDEEKLAAADVDTLEEVWGKSNGFPARAAARAGSVEAAAEKNIEAEKSSVYSPFDRANLYGSSGSSLGNYFNFRR